MIIDFNSFKNDNKLVTENTLRDVQVQSEEHVLRMAELFPELVNNNWGVE